MGKYNFHVKNTKKLSNIRIRIVGMHTSSSS